jgi:hypothetical protein
MPENLEDKFKIIINFVNMKKWEIINFFINYNLITTLH